MDMVTGGMVGMDRGYTETIAAIATAPGQAALGIIRVSGPQAINIVAKLLAGKQKERLTSASANTVHYALLEEEGELLDEVVLSLFRAPHSFTGEDIVEISCHGNEVVLQRVLQALVRAGATPAEPGEFTQRAFLHGKIDLAQAEAIADLIQAESEAARLVALQQLKGGYSGNLKELRAQMIELLAMLELELDFGEEDVEFANREHLLALISSALNAMQALADSFYLGQAMKMGVPVAIVGKPNVGKSTLLNLLLQEDRAIVSSIAGTTRDVIEETIDIGGIAFRLMDTAGLREGSEDVIENMGMERSIQKLQLAGLVLYLWDVSATSAEEVLDEIREIEEQMPLLPNRGGTKAPLVCLGTMVDKTQDGKSEEVLAILKSAELKHVWIGSLIGDTKDSQASRIEIMQTMLEAVGAKNETQEATEKNSTAGTRIQKVANRGRIVVSQARHYHCVLRGISALQAAQAGIENQNLSQELVAHHVREGIRAIGEISGQVSPDEVLGAIFSRFCIGK